MDTHGLLVSFHAMKRYAQRVDQMDVADDHFFTPEEKSYYIKRIHDHIRLSVPLPHQASLLIVKTKKRLRGSHSYGPDFGQIHAAANGNSWGMYAYDGQVCCVIEENIVKTVILLDEGQAATIDELIKRSTPPTKSNVYPEESVRMHMLGKAVERIILDPQRKLDFPPVADIELLFTSSLPSDPHKVTEEFLALILKWISRARYVVERPLCLWVTPQHEHLKNWLLLVIQSGLVIKVLHKPHDETDSQAYMDEVFGQPACLFTHTFVLCTRSMMTSAHISLEKKFGYIDSADSMRNGTLLYQFFSNERDVDRRKNRVIL